jgi:hypothetical protein
MNKAVGKLRCSLKKPESKQNWWMVLDCNTEEIGRYYRHLYLLERSRCHKLSRPYWGSHVTVVRNEKPPNHHLWWDYDGEEVIFHYRSGVRDNCGPERFRSFYWLDVVCPRFCEIRKELGLPPNPDRTYHMTIGSTENEANRQLYENMWKNG